MSSPYLAAVPSGELFYGAGCADKPLAEGTSKEFREFLASDSNGKILKERYDYQLESLKRLEELATSNFKHAASLNESLYIKGLENEISSHINVMQCKYTRILTAIDRLQTSHDSSMMTLTTRN